MRILMLAGDAPHRPGWQHEACPYKFSTSVRVESTPERMPLVVILADPPWKDEMMVLPRSLLLWREALHTRTASAVHPQILYPNHGRF